MPYISMSSFEKKLTMRADWMDENGVQSLRYIHEILEEEEEEETHCDMSEEHSFV